MQARWSSERLPIGRQDEGVADVQCNGPEWNEDEGYFARSLHSLVSGFRM